MTDKVNPINPAKSKFDKLTRFIGACFVWFGIAALIIFNTKEGSPRQEQFFMFLSGSEVLFAIILVYRVATGKLMSKPDQQNP